MKQWYEELFDNYAETYDREIFTQGTAGEVDFIEREIGHVQGCRVLDIGCGTGRHSIELARRGYRVTGVDLSPSQLERAREKARKTGAAVDFILGDARRLPFEGGFGLALILCEGGFSLMETDDMNFAILSGAARALDPGGKLILSCLSVLFPLYHSVKDFINNDPAGVLSKENSFDIMSFRDHSTIEVTDDGGRTKTLSCSERYYAPSEMMWLLSSLGFRDIAIHGCPLGAFSRANPLTVNDFEMLVIAEKLP